MIAAVNGPAIAGGMSLATIPDFTLAVPEAKFGLNEVRIGFAPALAATFLLRQVGEKRTRELLLTGRMLKAQEALQMGLVTEIVAPEELMQSARALAQTLLQNSPQAMLTVKRCWPSTPAAGWMKNSRTPSRPTRNSARPKTSKKAFKHASNAVAPTGLA